MVVLWRWWWRVEGPLLLLLGTVVAFSSLAARWVSAAHKCCYSERGVEDGVLMVSMNPLFYFLRARDPCCDDLAELLLARHRMACNNGERRLTTLRCGYTVFRRRIRIHELVELFKVVGELFLVHDRCSSSR